VTMPAAAYGELHLLPSILSADFCHLAADVDRVMDAGVRLIHVDVMDGHFVPNLTIGPPVVKCLARHVHARGGSLSVHLMIENPEAYLTTFVEAGADALSVHAEACTGLYHAVAAIKQLGAGAGVALNPGSDPALLGEVLPYLDFAVVMTVNPGFGGQEMIESALDKVPRLRRLLPTHVAIEVDGGVKRENVGRVVEAGANWIVAGSALFGVADPGAEAGVLQSLMAGSRPMW
jgi:ribulose-phosphate 3-epimerase